MKHVTWIFVVLLLCSLTSFVEKDVAIRGLNIGDAAPDFSIRNMNGEGNRKLKELKGRYVLLSFWASYDAPSRMQNALLDHALKRTGRSVEMVSVSFDEYKSIFDETVRKDGIETPDCFVETSGEASCIYKKYRLKKGFQNYLLNEEGVIVAKSITADRLSEYLN